MNKENSEKPRLGNKIIKSVVLSLILNYVRFRLFCFKNKIKNKVEISVVLILIALSVVTFYILDFGV